ncbi:enoyl-CoA hydratase/isomerase family protein [Xanthobacter dioxanivorans]|uniref:Enoyl-CoA hydratase/isomerase family protein n=1 Tax=Xanthobacter dioxanivorans TaxID=2528964 RepID=A0A974PPE5_9HYPH|nr:enoyl-CoA hydratase-related protein [Xanthobacter dioxanivorans]QRG07333.1 enoyl-CoA hydratase/isomerase family protein [Xanthobacter dioxanivorans]
MSDYEDVTYEKTGAVARLTVARPGRLNAYRDQTADELKAAFARAEADPDVRCAVLTGEGRAFGAGYDLSSIAPDTLPALDAVLEDHFNPLVRQMRDSRLPIVAMVNGPCAGAAVGIALATDIVVAGRSAYFYQPFAGLALVPDAGNSAFLTHLSGRVRAAGMMLLGEKISAEEALSFGLVWQVHDDAALAQEAEMIATRLATLDPGAVAATKRLIRHASDSVLSAQLDLERDLQGELGRQPPVHAAIAAFFATKGGRSGSASAAASS